MKEEKDSSKFEGLRSQIPNDIKAAMESICLAWAQQKGLDEASRMAIPAFLPIPAVDVLDLIGGRSCMMPNCDNPFIWGGGDGGCYAVVT